MSCSKAPPSQIWMFAAEITAQEASFARLYVLLTLGWCRQRSPSQGGRAGQRIGRLLLPCAEWHAIWQSDRDAVNSATPRRPPPPGCWTPPCRTVPPSLPSCNCLGGVSQSGGSHHVSRGCWISLIRQGGQPIAGPGAGPASPLARRGPPLTPPRVQTLPPSV